MGTSHVSLTSAEHVARVVHAVRPNNTVVELCRSRASIMYIDESSAAAGSAGGLGRPGGGGAGSTPAAGNEFALGGTSGFAQSLQRSLRLGGAPALLIRAALAAVSARLGAKVGASPGGEFRAARSAALACGSQIVLGDRPLEITLSRAWASASTKDRAEFAAFLFRGAARGRAAARCTATAISPLSPPRGHSGPCGTPLHREARVAAFLLHRGSVSDDPGCSPPDRPFRIHP